MNSFKYQKDDKCIEPILYFILSNVFTNIVGCEPVLLMEDAMVSGFVPLLSAPIEISYVHKLVDKVCYFISLLLCH